jgi:DMSO/TMAO reductase YedYZ molybdopterin-dependent catalytic subunit
VTAAGRVADWHPRPGRRLHVIFIQPAARLRTNSVGKSFAKALAGAASGEASLAAFFGASELVAIATGPTSSPAIAFGQFVIAHTPEWLKNFAIGHFGEDDKLVLTIGIYFVFVVLAAVAGAAAGALEHALVAIAAAGVLGAATGAAAATQPGASALQVLPSVAGALAAATVSARLGRWRTSAGGRRPATSAALATAVSANQPLSRRQLFRAGSLLALGAASYAIGHQALAKAYNAVASRAAVKLPTPVSTTRIVKGTSFNIGGLAPYITPNHDFYRVDTALVVPQLPTEGYTLTVHGMVRRPAIFSFEDLLNMPMIERTITMVCVSDPVGGPYVGNARWLGVPLAHILSLVRPDPRADQLFMTSSDGMTIGADLRAALDGRAAMLAVGMNGEPLPFEHGFPVRAVIPGFYGYASACKWLVDLEVTNYAAKKAYWVQRGYALDGRIKLESKIDTPTSFAQLKAGPVTVAGSAWHPTVGISKVEISVDGGPWHEASLAAAESVDTWRLWRWQWGATPGSHTIEARATDNDGQVQISREAPVFPSGASGLQSVVVTVT